VCICVRSAFRFVGAPKDFIDVGGRSTDRKMVLESGITLSHLDDDFLNDPVMFFLCISVGDSYNRSRGSRLGFLIFVPRACPVLLL
jgi:hypothetical protein